MRCGVELLRVWLAGSVYIGAGEQQCCVNQVTKVVHLLEWMGVLLICCVHATNALVLNLFSTSIKPFTGVSSIMACARSIPDQQHHQAAAAAAAAVTHLVPGCEKLLKAAVTR